MSDVDRSKAIREALKKLDLANDDHWTADKLPRLSALGIDVKREEVTAAAPHFSRDNPNFDLPPALQRKKEADDKLKELDAKQKQLEAERRAAVAVQDSALRELDKPSTPQDLSKSIQLYHEKLFQQELADAANKAKIDAAMKSLLPPEPSPLDTALARETIKREKEQAIHPHEQRV